MEPWLNEARRRLLATIFDRGAEDASAALTRWLGRPVRVRVGGVEEVDLDEATALLGPPEELLAAVALTFSGRLDGLVLLTFDDRSGLALADLPLRRPVGTASQWGELEQSAACETANIVACADLNSLAVHLPLPEAGPGPSAIVPSPPGFRHEFAGSLIEFALMEQATRLDRLLVVRHRFETEGLDLDWSLLLVPSLAALDAMAEALSALEAR